MLSLRINNLDVALRGTRFTDGAYGLKLEGTLPRHCESAQVYAPLAYVDPQSLLFEIKCVVDILRNINPRIVISLFLPYLPYARQDRRMEAHDALTLKIFCNDINGLQLDSVIVMDVHSDAGTITLNNVTHIEQHQILSVNPLRYELSKKEGGFDPVLVGPDAGSLKKIGKVASVIPHSGLVTLGKERDVVTRELGPMKVLDSTLYRLEGRRAIIFDDICDGGRTFMQAAGLLKELGAEVVDLYITHGIFSYGVGQILEAGINHIYTTDSVRFGDEINQIEQVSVIRCRHIAETLNIRGV